MASSRPTPNQQADLDLLRYVDQHLADQTNPHVNGTPAAGQVPTYQGSGVTSWATPPGAAGGAPVGSATPQINNGTGTTGTSASSSHEDHVHPAFQIGPPDYGLSGWSNDPALFTTTGTLISGTLIFTRVKLAKSGPVSTVYVPITTGGTSLTSSWVAVYALDGTLLGQSADQGTGWQSAGTKTVALSSPTASQPAGTTVLVGLLVIGTTGPALRYATAAPSLNQNITAAQGYRVGTLAGLSTPPSPLVLSSTASGSSMPLLLVA